jgi:hypothetical protein
MMLSTIELTGKSGMKVESPRNRGENALGFGIVAFIPEMASTLTAGSLMQCDQV